MSSYNTPPGSEKEPEGMGHSEGKSERKMPDFIFVDQAHHNDNKRIGDSSYQDPKHMFGSIQTMAKGKQPFYLRILAFLGTFVMLFGCVLVLMITLIAFFFSLILFRQSDSLNNQANIAWRSFKKAVVFTLGCFVCIFNMSFGIGIVLMYFMLSGEQLSHRFMQEMTKHQL